MYRVLWCALGVGDRGTKKLTSLNAFVWGMATRGVCVRLLLSLCTLLLSLSLSRSLACSLSLSLSLSASLACSLARSLSLHRSLSHSLSDSLARAHATSPSLSHAHTHKHTHNTSSVHRACRYMSSCDSGCQRLTFLFFVFRWGSSAKRRSRAF